MEVRDGDKTYRSGIAGDPGRTGERRVCKTDPSHTQNHFFPDETINNKTYFNIASITSHIRSLSPEWLFSKPLWNWTQCYLAALHHWVPPLPRHQNHPQGTCRARHRQDGQAYCREHSRRPPTWSMTAYPHEIGAAASFPAVNPNATSGSRYSARSWPGTWRYNGRIPCCLSCLMLGFYRGGGCSYSIGHTLSRQGDTHQVRRSSGTSCSEAFACNQTNRLKSLGSLCVLQ